MVFYRLNDKYFVVVVVVWMSYCTYCLHVYFLHMQDINKTPDVCFPRREKCVNPHV